MTSCVAHDAGGFVLTAGGCSRLHRLYPARPDHDGMSVQQIQDSPQLLFLSLSAFKDENLLLFTFHCLSYVKKNKENFERLCFQAVMRRIMPSEEFV